MLIGPAQSQTKIKSLSKLEKALSSANHLRPPSMGNMSKGIMFMYSGKHPEFSLLPRQPGFSFVSLSLSSQYLKHPEIFVHYAMDLMSLETLFQKSKPTRKIKAKSFGLLLSFQERGTPEKQQEKITKQKKKFEWKKGRPRYALAVS